MVAAAVFSPGINAESITANARAQPVGQQKARYVADVVTLLGTNPMFEVVLNGVVIYRTHVVGALAHSSAGIALPQSFNEPPSLNSANALTAGTSIRLSHLTNTTVAVTVPVRVGGGTDFLTASSAMDGTQPVRTNGVLFAPPVELDPGVIVEPPPPGSPPPAGTGFWSSARVNEAIQSSAGNYNNMQIMGLTAQNENWINKATISFGSRWNDLQPGNWGWPHPANQPADFWMQYMEPWGFIFSEEGSVGSGSIQMRNWDFQVRDIDTNAWRRPYGSKVSTLNWADYYTVNSSGGIGGTGVTPPSAAGSSASGGGWKITLNSNNYGTRHSHFGFIPLHFVPRVQVNGQKNFTAVIVTCEFRLGDESESGFKAGLQVGGDPKPAGNGDQMGMPYFIAFANSKTMKATSSWQRITATNVNPAGESMVDRRISATDFSAEPPME